MVYRIRGITSTIKATTCSQSNSRHILLTLIFAENDDLMKRIFTACKITVDEHLMAFIKETQRCFAGSAIKWVETHNMHLTLIFYGDTDEMQLKRIKDATQPIANECKRFSLLTSKQGFFGTATNPKVLWLGLDEPTGELAKAQQKLKKAALIDGIQLDDKPFKMHLTIGRINRGVTEQMLKQWLNTCNVFAPSVFAIPEITIYESLLTPKGPIYKPIAVFKLA